MFLVWGWGRELAAALADMDILFVLIVPEQKTDEHVKTLAGLAELFLDEDFCFTLRQTRASEDLYNIAITY